MARVILVCGPVKIIRNSELLFVIKLYPPQITNHLPFTAAACATAENSPISINNIINTTI